MLTDWIKTKIVCTIGPSTASRKMLTQLAKAGMNVARINLAHGEPTEHAARVRVIRAISKELKKPIGVLFDLPGPKIRIGKLSPDPIRLKEGDLLTLTHRRVLGNHNVVPVSRQRLFHTLRRADLVYLADGTIRLRVQKPGTTEVVCRVIRGGSLFSGKGVNVPGKELGLRALTSNDVELLRFAVKNRADFLGISFVANGSDIVKAKRLIRPSKAWIIAKIETRQAVENFDDIVHWADGIMVARGDLGVEMDVEELPVLQKKIIAKANSAAKPVITATQMLESMLANPVPTRAEVTDVANAIIDGTDAVMLSEETAVGRFPLEAVRVMRKVAAATEATIPYRDLLENRRFLVKKTQDAVSFSACEVAYELGASCIVAHTRTGTTAHRVSKFRSPVPIIALTYSDQVMNRLSLLWGLYPHKVTRLSTTREIFKAAKAVARVSKMTRKGDRIIVVCGDPSTPSGTTDLMRIQIV